jgi:hypothetical protein
MERNLEKIDGNDIIYLNNKIIAYKYQWGNYNSEKGRWGILSKINCHIYFNSSLHPFNLGNCNDGSQFMSINQAINQAKYFIDTCNKYGW